MKPKKRLWCARYRDRVIFVLARTLDDAIIEARAHLGGFTGKLTVSLTSADRGRE